MLSMSLFLNLINSLEAVWVEGKAALLIRFFALDQLLLSAGKCLMESAWKIHVCIHLGPLKVPALTLSITSALVWDKAVGFFNPVRPQMKEVFIRLRVQAVGRENLTWQTVLPSISAYRWLVHFAPKTANAKTKLSAHIIVMNISP